MLSLLAIVVLIATLMTLFYQQVSRGVGSGIFVVVWLLSAFLAPWLVHPLSLILLAAGVAVIAGPQGRAGALQSRPHGFVVFEAQG